jgi:glucosyl-dolichyl phosphate glucuronosyltransferase
MLSWIRTAPRVQLEIIVCTYNRHSSLRNLVTRLEAVLRESADTRVIVVENSDDASAVDANRAFLKQSPLIQLVQSRPGKLSAARNEGLRRCRAPYVAFIDDDAEPSAQWAHELIRSFDEGGELVAGVGGPIFPIWKTERPPWLSDRLLGPLTVLDLGEQARPLRPAEYVFGTNMAFRTQHLKAQGGFDENLGRLGNKILLSNEETDLQDRLRKDGYAIWYNPHAAVGHVVHEDRLAQDWFLRRMAWQAVSDAMRADVLPEAERQMVRESVEHSCTALGIDPERLLGQTDDPVVFEARVDLAYWLTRRFMSLQ